MVITDWNMPEMSGVGSFGRCARTRRRDAAGADGHHQRREDDIVEAPRRRNNYVVKPFTPRYDRTRFSAAFATVDTANLSWTLRNICWVTS